MKLKRSKFFLTLFTVITLGLMPVSAAYAATPTFGHKFQSGVGNITVWLNYNSGIGYWANYITNASNNWKSPGWSNPINITPVSSNVGSKIDFHRNNDAYFGGGMNILAATKFFSSSGSQINPSTANWEYTEIHINHNTFSKPSFTNAQALGTVIHEMGHAFGLAHYNTNKYSIMCQTASGRIVQKVQKTDNDAINILY